MSVDHARGCVSEVMLEGSLTAGDILPMGNEIVIIEANLLSPLSMRLHADPSTSTLTLSANGRVKIDLSGLGVGLLVLDVGVIGGFVRTNQAHAPRPHDLFFAAAATVAGGLTLPGRLGDYYVIAM